MNIIDVCNSLLWCCVKVFEACGEEGEKGRQMLLFSATMPPWVDKVCVCRRERQREGRREGETMGYI